jgi:hypothetical protein
VPGVRNQDSRTASAVRLDEHALHAGPWCSRDKAAGWWVLLLTFITMILEFGNALASNLLSTQLQQNPGPFAFPVQHPPVAGAILIVATWPRSQPGSAVSLRIPRDHVPDADSDSDRARLPGTGQRRVLGRLRMCRAKG